MKLVFTTDEVAAALQKTPAEFVQLRPKLEAFGFPPPVRGLDDRWSIIDVMNWLNNSDPHSSRQNQSQNQGWERKGVTLS